MDTAMMKNNRPWKWLIGVVSLLVVPWTSVSALAQDTDIFNLPMSQLRGEIRAQYTVALAATRDVNIIYANDSSFLWASETKVQCGIALGYLRSSTRDAESIRKCGFYYEMLTARPAEVFPSGPSPLPVTQFLPPVPVPVRPSESVVCPPELASTFFFDWDSVEPPTDAAVTVNYIVDNQSRCGWENFSVIGHTDRSGSDSYNDRLSVRRAQVIADIMVGSGIAADRIDLSGRGERDLRVETLDGERSLANRRVEVEIREVK